ncbi:hypothetical protein QR680_007870 [Steinernema hermaphroditum]|uniref:Uncharacterized protein n=1 Tax=Steinernema hermaphroditum TaxID=289476 RepID=A0AA39IGP7_9BILA|nr:hypothetical protein QR680_007870 [Steinernema hermaphroditum]
MATSNWAMYINQHGQKSGEGRKLVCVTVVGRDEEQGTRSGGGGGGWRRSRAGDAAVAATSLLEEFLVWVLTILKMQSAGQ